ncbi:hypothetical protein VXO70_19260, partial [Escherichia coli]
GNGSHASTLKSPSYTKSVSWQHYPDAAIRFSHQNVYSTPALRVKKINIALRYPIKSVPGNNNRILF